MATLGISELYSFLGSNDKNLLVWPKETVYKEWAKLGVAIKARPLLFCHYFSWFHSIVQYCHKGVKYWKRNIKAKNFYHFWA